ncbi:zinc-binding dehydrogenase [Mesorhizobium australicum]|uniref:zinc-binding dehydrogenase n=1 Tax=Mesorhizobium australicum TaxID=536018 RepID=UPI003335F6C7
MRQGHKRHCDTRSRTRRCRRCRSLTARLILITRAACALAKACWYSELGRGVNTAAIQIAKLAGCRVYATTSTAEKAEMAKQLGAEQVLDYIEGLVWPARSKSQQDGVDVVVVGAATMRDSLRVVRKGGRIVSVGNTSGPFVEIDLRYFFSKQISLIVRPYVRLCR